MIINVHGGAWIMGDALVLDTQSSILSEKTGALVVNVNYKKADIQPFPYAQNEVFDSAKYFIDNASRYNVDTSRIILMGYSAGAHLCAVVATMLRDIGINPELQVLCYPFTDFTCGGGRQTEIKEKLDSIAFMDEVLFAKVGKDTTICSPAMNVNFANLAPAVIITCGNDPLKIQGDEYAAKLRDAGVKVRYFHYTRAIHGFMECNYPETRKDGSKSPEQELLCRDCLETIISIINGKPESEKENAIIY